MSGASRDARSAALAALLALDEVGTLDRAWERIGLPEDGRDAALARELALGAARWLRLYDHLAAPFLRHRPPPVLAWGLRIGCHQLFALDRVPPSAAVDASVAAVAANGGGRQRAAANAVLRRLAELRLEERVGEAGPLGRLVEAAWPSDPGVRASLGEQLLADLRPALEGGPDRRVEDLDRLPPLCLRARPGVTVLPHPALLRQEGEWSWWSDPGAAIARWVEPGHCVVQDRAQGRLAESLAQLGWLRPGRLAADWCAAPGGKAAALAEHHLRVVACDQPARIGQVDPALLRLAHDGRRGALDAAFDLVLVDAPCSNSGTFGRHPEARWRHTRASRDALVALQKGLLRAAARAVRADGCLVYATCSVLPCENQGVAHALDGWRLLAEHSAWPDGWQGGGYHALLVRS